jgi:hypothetical protein
VKAIELVAVALVAVFCITVGWILHEHYWTMAPTLSDPGQKEEETACVDSAWVEDRIWGLARALWDHAHAPTAVETLRVRVPEVVSLDWPRYLRDEWVVRDLLETAPVAPVWRMPGEVW